MAEERHTAEAEGHNYRNSIGRKISACAPRCIAAIDCKETRHAAVTDCGETTVCQLAGGRSVPPSGA